MGRVNLGVVIRARREGRGYDLARFSELSGLSLSYLSDIERGRTLPSLESLDRCATALGTHVRALLRGVYPWDGTAEPGSAGPLPDGRRHS